MRRMMLALALSAVMGCKGETGPAGTPGAAGQDGADGVRGQDGTDGDDGAPGPGERWHDATGAVIPLAVNGYGGQWQDADGVWWPVHLWTGLVDLSTLPDALAVFVGPNCTGDEYIWIDGATLSFAQVPILVGGELRYIEAGAAVGQGQLTIASEREADGTCIANATQVDASRYVPGASAPTTTAPTGRVFVPLVYREVVE